MLIDSRVEAAYSTVGVAVARRAMASINGGIRFLPIDPTGDVDARIQSSMPTGEAVTLRPTDDNNGIVEDPTTLTRMYFVLVAGEGTDADDVYELTKTIFEHKPELASALGAFNRFDTSQMARDISVPFHEGALRFYREAGLIE
jgi:TRAP-type uncharacterized transport system substrate-binding protein